jgi:ATP-dependent helicase HrpA
VIAGARFPAHQLALLGGLLGSVGCLDGGTEGYLGARGIRFHVHPGSGLAKKRPRWVIAAELVETSRLFARCAAKIEPEWIETVAGDRVTRDYFEPRWDNERGEVVASERVQLYGLTLVPRRRVSFGSVDPRIAREVFIREALVPGALATKGAFLAHNRKLVAAVAELEHKARRQDVLVDDEAIAGFYAARLPEGVHSLATFEQWRAGAERRDPRALYLSRDTLMRHAAAHVTEELFPEKLAMAGTELALKYRFAPGQPGDGLTLTVPLALLNQIDPARLSWLVPGLVREKITVLLKALPKALRNRLMPLPDTVTAFLEAVPPGCEPLPDALGRWLESRRAEAPSASAWDDVAIPAHLEMQLRVVDAAGRELATGRDLAALRAQLGEAAQLSFAQSQPALERRGLKAWTFGDLPETLTAVAHGQRLTGYPALIDDTESVSIALLDTRAAADASTRAGVVRLLRIALKASLATYDKGGAGFASAAMQLRTSGPPDRLLADVLAAICDRAFVGDDSLPRSEAAFAEQTRRARTRLPAVAEGAFRLLAAIAAAHHALGQRIGASPPALARPVAAVRRRRDALVYPGFFRATPWAQVAHLPRYLAALDRRLVKFPENPARDARHSDAIEKWWERYRERRGGGPATADAEAALENFRWLLEELSVSLFAQELKTPFPVSLKRVERAWADMGR